MTISYETIFNAATAASALGSAMTIGRLISTDWTTCKVASLVLLVVFLTLLGAVCQYLRHLRPSDSYGWISLLKRIILKVITGTLGRYSVWKLRRAYRSSSAMRKIQEAALIAIIKQSRETIFGCDHRFSEIQGIEDYRARVPVRDYADLDKYNQLAYRGEPNVYFPGPVEFLAKTSGTTGKNKTFPGTKKHIRNAVLAYFGCNYVYDDFVSKSGRASSLAPLLTASVYAPDRKNEYGIPVGPFSKFFGTHDDISTTPLPALQRVCDAKSAFYLHSVFALWNERIGEVNVFFPSILITFIRSITSNWDSVLKDIATGRLSPDKVPALDKDLIDQLNRRLTPKPERAAQLRALFGDGQDLSGFFERAWPDVPGVMLVRSGSFLSSYRYLQKYLGKLPTFGPFLGGTEGMVGINMTVRDVDYNSPERYHPLLGPSFTEFIPVDANGNDLGDAKLAFEMEIGGLYETVQTSFNCFRLRTGDVIRVVMKDECAPVFEISHRKSHVLSVHVEKTTEKSLQACVLLAAQRLTCQVVDFTAADCFLYETVAGVSLGTKYYAMFVELDGDRRLTAEEKLKFDRALRDSMENYELFRSEGHIDLMQVVQVKTGAFLALRQAMLAANKDASEVQFKMPRVVRSEDQVKCLLEHRI